MKKRKNRSSKQSAPRRMVIDDELKYYDTWANTVTLQANGTWVGNELPPQNTATRSLTTIPRGDSASNRIGNKTILKSVYVTGVISYPQTSPAAAAKQKADIYLALVLQKNPKGVNLKSEQVYVNNGAETRMGVAPLRNMDYVGEYQVLDRIHMKHDDNSDAITTHTDVTTGFAVWLYHREDIKFKLSWRGEIPQHYGNGSTADIANLIQNNIQLVGITADGARTPNISYQARVRFIG